MALQAADALNKIPQHGSDQPRFSYLSKHVVRQAAHKWRNLGEQLLNDKQKIMLKVIEVDHPHDVVSCCKHALETWLKSTPDASWNQLISALRSPTVQLDSLADQLEEMLSTELSTNTSGSLDYASSSSSSPSIKGSNRPKLKDIHRHVVQQAAHKWRDIGVSLEVVYLKMEMIAADHPHDDVRCLMGVLDTWLMNTPDASWNQLISALRSPTVQLDSLADQLEQMMSTELSTSSSDSSGSSSSPSIKVDECPDDKHLNKYVRGKVCAAGTDKWRDLGIVLMGQSAEFSLNVIKVNCPDVKECCSRMFTAWRQRTPKASWKQLIEALKEVELTQLASELERLLQPTELEEQSALVTNEQQQSLTHFKGSDRPTLKQLHMHVVLEAALKWKHLGAQLLQDDRFNVLNVIEANYPNDSVGCCKLFLMRWLEVTPDPSWNQLITALRSPTVQLDSLADQLEQMMSMEYGFLPPKVALTVQTAAPLPCTGASENQNKILETKPYMIDLKNIVTRRIMNQWEYVADALYYDIATIEAIKQQRGCEDPRQCCREFFKDWLTTNNGNRAGPKVWSTLIGALKEVDEIATDIVDDIVKEVLQLKCD